MPVLRLPLCQSDNQHRDEVLPRCTASPVFCITPRVFGILPWTVPSPAEKIGGLDKGLTTLSRNKTQIVTKTSTKGTSRKNMTPCSERRKEPASPIRLLIVFQENLTIRNMERENHVRSTQSSPNSKGTTRLQHNSTRY